ncbi:MAG: long-chain fatty acid--CoA ligase [Alphaproteobacteria bacterium]|nr:long-chain fatty acid--CoA ligase [Alphaproteobacteria bacterium]
MTLPRQPLPKPKKPRPRTARHPWLAHYPAHVPATVAAPKGGLPQIFLNSVAAYPTRPYLTFLGRTFDYTAIHTRATALAAALQGLRLPPHSRVALCLPNCPAYVAAFWGTLLAGHVVVNLNPLLTAVELHHELVDSGASVLLTFNLHPTFGKLQEAVRGSAVKQVWVADLAADMPDLTAFGFKLLKWRDRVRTLPPGWYWKYEMMGHFADFKPVPLRGSQPALLQYTGGTTGTPKAAILTHASLLANTTQVRAWLGAPRPEGEVMVAVLPLFHVFALTAILNLGTAIAAHLVLMPQFALPTLLKIITRYQPTLLPGVPTLFNALATNPKAAKVNLRCLRFCISGGAPLPQAVKQAFEAKTGARVAEGYGLTEASPVLACNPSIGEATPGSVGYPLPGTAIQIRSDKPPFAVKKPGEIGEIWAKGPQLMAGYWHNPAATAQVLRRGWLRTGDLGFVDQSGALHVVDRLKDMIIVNGYKVYPRQLEEVLAQHPAVAEVIVLGVPHPKTGEAPKAFVTLKGAAQAEELRRWANARLNKLAQLVAVEVRDVLPKTLVGKLSRKELAAAERASG